MYKVMNEQNPSNSSIAKGFVIKLLIFPTAQRLSPLLKT